MDGNFQISSMTLENKGRAWKIQSRSGYIRGYVVRFPVASLQGKMPPLGFLGHRCEVRGEEFYIEFPGERKALLIIDAEILHMPTM